MRDLRSLVFGCVALAGCSTPERQPHDWNALLAPRGAGQVAMAVYRPPVPDAGFERDADTPVELTLDGRAVAALRPGDCAVLRVGPGGGAGILAGRWRALGRTVAVSAGPVDAALRPVFLRIEARARDKHALDDGVDRTRSSKPCGWFSRYPCDRPPSHAPVLVIHQMPPHEAAREARLCRMTGA
ncbi:MAG: hypothetical protein HQL36_00815 [Alphaproteobacteria bacterium]|nr:hypothetical protein [Alphaproteobacteria bacterium]MBF0251195.1 hypothetical protein [Alphaproteobacteria bacterium]